ncbi:hypothetical protein LEP1GSC020_4451 [Leptospira interrogans serovar Grippotyphosa str. 2006006986]|nr:hypothetical protein LEP1GSC007_1131 [Leptospira interrogans serovar Bulgarica str. Mallika]EJP17091.1 hypothetical protein LEP1GSC080_2588 [Leptospira interrogans str. FPW2026]EKO88617.1 hypothetical protein LEP1GSC009_1028 [Leptospira interrogans serovar Grippotyphosa str. Andaman]EKP84257.1 hypothetical protein LEP1GSC020_4451 [Leptospira interrogans serovar Grippotyphosa str. 2006006986]
MVQLYQQISILVLGHLLVQNAKLARFDPFVYLGNLFKSSERKPRALFFLDFQ